MGLMVALWVYERHRLDLFRKSQFVMKVSERFRFFVADGGIDSSISWVSFTSVSEVYGLMNFIRELI